MELLYTEVFSMLLSLLNFIWIFISAFLTGFAVCRLFIRTSLLSEKQLHLDIILFGGLATLTAGAQWFSLFYRVGIIANLTLFIINLAIFLFFFRQILSFWKKLLHACNIYKYLLFIVCFTLFFAAVASTHPSVYDTSLYHNQAIQWIEKYGVVKGLGNLHNRLAYNSAFFALQALFSWSTIIGQSLHGMNGFIALIFLCYALFRLLRVKASKASSKHYYIEQFFNLLILIQIYTCILQVSSPGTDFLSMLLILYIFSKWAQDDSLSPFLFLLSLFGLTVKLSIAALVVIGLPILINILRKRQWKLFFAYFFAGVWLVVPFLARNVIISGYLLYPSTMLDLFSVDWKMPTYTVTFDNHEIIAWGRRVNDVYKYEWPITQWFPYWFAEMTLPERILFVSQAALIPASLVFSVYNTLKRRNTEITFMLCTSIIGLFMWFFSAPLIRYGNVYLYLLVAILAGWALERLSIKGQVVPCLYALCACILLILIPVTWFPEFEVIRLHMPSDYSSYICATYEIAPEVYIYYPSVEPECTGYDTFPSTAYPKRLELIELRGTQLKDGFRMKEEYRNAKVTTYGDIDP